jgi:hypothetical protein
MTEKNATARPQTRDTNVATQQVRFIRIILFIQNQCRNNLLGKVAIWINVRGSLPKDFIKAIQDGHMEKFVIVFYCIKKWSESTIK